MKSCAWELDQSPELLINIREKVIIMHFIDPTNLFCNRNLLKTFKNVAPKHSY